MDWFQANIQQLLLIFSQMKAILNIKVKSCNYLTKYKIMHGSYPYLSYVTSFASAMHTVISQNFCSFSICYFCQRFSTLHYLLRIFFWNHNVQFSNSSLKIIQLFKNFFLTILIPSYGSRVLGSVFKMGLEFKNRQFESIETSPGFIQFLGENLV